MPLSKSSATTCKEDDLVRECDGYFWTCAPISPASVSLMSLVSLIAIVFLIEFWYLSLMVFSCSLGHVYRKKEPLVNESNGILSDMCP